MILHMRHTLWTGISETNVNVITSATRTHAIIIIIITMIADSVFPSVSVAHSFHFAVRIHDLVHILHLYLAFNLYNI